MRHRTLLLALTLLAAPLAAMAQDKRPADERPQRIRGGPDGSIGYAGGSLALALPVGDFRNYVSVGGGINGFVAMKLARDGAASIRLDGTFLIYGSDTYRTQLSPTIPQVNVDVTTSNLIFGMAVGPQLMRPSGAVRPYVSGGVGFSYFATVSSVSGTHDVEPFAESTNFDDFTLAWRGAAGLLIQVGRGRTPIWLDFSGHFVRNGMTRYLRPGGIDVDPITNGLIIDPVESETAFWLVHAGVTFGIQPRSR